MIFSLPISSNPISENSFKNKSIVSIPKLNTSQRKYNATGLYDINLFANYSHQEASLTNVHLQIPSNEWNVSKVKLEFDNIGIGQESVTLEDDPDGFKVLKNNIERLAMQVRIDELTIIYSIELFGFALEQTTNPNPIYFLLTGWDSVLHEPNLSINYGIPINLNISNIAGWYTQTFEEPITLLPGNYSIVLDGYPQIKNKDNYYWFVNNSAIDSDLHVSSYKKVGADFVWVSEYQSIFCHRINRWVNKSFNPSEINMSLKIEDTNYFISDGANAGSGIVLVDNVNLNSLESQLYFPVEHNQSLQLNFNLNASMALLKINKIRSRIEIGLNSTNHWNLYPEIDRCSPELKVEIPIPQNWFNIEIYKDDSFVTDDPNIIFINNSLHIFNNTIEDNIEWRVSAMSMPKSFFIFTTSGTFHPAEDISIILQSTFLQGTYYLQIEDANNYTIYEKEFEISPEINTFNYLIRNDAVEGTWRATVYWYNSTDAALATTIFYVDVPIILPPIIIFFAIISGILISAVSYGSYKVFQLKKQKKAVLSKKLTDKVRDLINLQYLMVVDKNSSLDLFTQSFSDKALDLSLVSGFLDAIRSFGIELTESSEQSQVIKLEYHESKIIMSEYKGFRLILIMKEVPSNQFLESLKKLLVQIDSKFSRFLDNFCGDIRPFKYVERLIVQTLGTSFIYPIKINDRKDIKIPSAEKDFINRAKTFMKATNKDYIFISQLIGLKKFNPLMVNMVNSLIKKRIFDPILGYNNI